MPTDPIIGQVLLGLFRVTDVIGGGATGTVYRGWQIGMERDVAIKILHPELAGDPDLRLRFFREARAVARLSHRNIVTVFLVDETPEGQPYLVMEYVRGQTLESVLEGEAGLETGRALAIARQIASALAEAHGIGVVHRDLKPANILIAERGRAADLVKVVDFGVAKLVGTDVPMAPGESHLTRQGAVFGTPAYLSPEQARGTDVDARADIYSFGVMLYQLVTGALPFTGEGIAVLLAHINKAPPPPRSVWAGIDPALEALILQCLEKDPAARPQSAEALLAALDNLGARPRVVSGEPRVVSGERPRVVSGEPRFVSNEAGGSAMEDSDWALAMPARRPWRIWLAVLVVGAGGVVGWRWWAGEKSAASPPAVSTEGRDGQVEPVPATPSGPQRAVIAAAAGYSLRVLVPDPVIAQKRVTILIDAWDEAGVPLTADSLTVTLGEGPQSAHKTARAGNLPGRYVLAATLPPGETALGVVIPGPGTTITVYVTATER